MDRALQSGEAGLARLLARLDPEPDRAGREYEELRRRLIKFFDWRGAYPPDECADVTLDRLAVKFAENVEIVDLHRYVHGIARMVLMERHRKPSFAPLDQAPEQAVGPHVVPGEDDLMRDCFERCLAELPPDSRSTVLTYYEHRGQTKIDSRRRLAGSLGVTDNALRSRVQRLRDRLEACTMKCVTTGEGRR